MEKIYRKINLTFFAASYFRLPPFFFIYSSIWMAFSILGLGQSAFPFYFQRKLFKRDINFDSNSLWIPLTGYVTVQCITQSIVEYMVTKATTNYEHTFLKSGSKHSFVLTHTYTIAVSVYIYGYVCVSGIKWRKLCWQSGW